MYVCMYACMYVMYATHTIYVMHACYATQGKATQGKGAQGRLHARILVPLALSCASGVALHAGPREQCSPTTAGVHQGPCSQGYASVGRTRSGLRLLTRSLAQMRRRCAAMHMDDHGATDRPLAVKIRTSDSIALGLTSSSLRDHGVSVHAKQSQQASALCARKPESRHLTPTPSA